MAIFASDLIYQAATHRSCQCIIFIIVQSKSNKLSDELGLSVEEREREWDDETRSLRIRHYLGKLSAPAIGQSEACSN